MKQERIRRAVVLFSGGLDSTTTLAIAIREGYDVYALTIDYGQKHAIEVENARQIAADMKVNEHKVMSVDLASLGGSALTDESISVPKDRSPDEISHGIPVTYVPARNLIFLSLATALAEAIGSTDIFIGVNIVDFSGYPDCRPDFITAFENAANLGTRMGTEDSTVKVHSPLSGLSKADIIRTGMKLGVDYSMTHSCYDPGPTGLACGTCDSCLLRKKGFSEAKVPDPTRYAV